MQKELSMATIVTAASLGTMIEWYDYFVFGSLGSVLANKFYRTGTPSSDLITWLATFAIGFIVRPFGAVVFGYFGDVFGRKYTFMITLVLMGAGTFLVGCLPTYDDIGPAAGYILIFLRIIQGLAIGGEYSGAATVISEHAPQDKRGFYTSFVQATATGGMLLSLLIILAFSYGMGTKFQEFGWRFPFLLSIVLLFGSIIIRRKLRESPMFEEREKSGKNPLVESFTNPVNLKYVLLSLFGATAGQGIVWYTGQYYSLFFIQNTLKTPLNQSYIIVSVALLLGSPLFILVGWLSDKYGRKKFMMAGLFLATATFYPLFMAMYHFRPFVDKAGTIASPNYSPVMLSFIVWIMVGYVALVYAPIAAFLVELFPTRIRYTSMSFPYHVGNGIFGGLVPVIGLSVQKATGNDYAGLWYPMIVSGVCFIVMALFVPETYQVDIKELDFEKKLITETEKEETATVVDISQ